MQSTDYVQSTYDRTYSFACFKKFDNSLIIVDLQKKFMKS